MGNQKLLAEECIDQRPATVADLSEPWNSCNARMSSRGDCPTKIGRFEVLRHVSQGGMGDVYHAIDEQLQRQVAIKVPRHDVTNNLETRNRLIREARLMAGLSHRNLIQVYESGMWDGQWYVASQWAPCGDLASFISNRQGVRSNVTWCTDMLEQLASALATCHANNIIHLDIKPANIVFEASDHANEAVSDCVDTPLNVPSHPLLTDFGLARLLDRDMDQTLTSTGLGTPYYMAPEQITGNEREIGPQSDVFSFGVVMHELLYGVRPFQGKNAVEVLYSMQTNARVARKFSGHVPKIADQICERCLMFAPEDRYASAVELHQDLKQLANDESFRIQLPSPVRRAQRWCEQSVQTRDAGMLAIWLQGALCISLMSLVGLKCLGLAASIPSSTMTLASDVGMILLFPTLPCIWAGIYTVANRKWAFLANCAMSAGFVLMVLGSLITQHSPLTFYNENPLAFFIGHSIILTLALVQFGAHLMAFPSVKWITKRCLGPVTPGC